MKGIFTTALVVASLVGSLSTAIAEPPCSPQDAYCLYVTGLMKEDGQRWFRINFTSTGESPVETEIMCDGPIEESKNFVVGEILKSSLTEQFDVEGQLYICESPEGPCDPVSKGNFSASCEEGADTCVPASQKVVLSRFEKTHYPKCDGINSLNKTRLRR